MLSIEVSLPFGSTGTIDPPLTDASIVTVDGRSSDAPTEVGPGRHVVVVTRPRVADPGRGSVDEAASVVATADA